ncbi:MAG: hypothetical protein ACTHK4_11235, partial [Mycobacteriales bacterium]
MVDRWIEHGHDVEVLCTSTRFADAGEAAPQPHVRRSLEWYWADHDVLRPGLRRRIAIEHNNQRALADALAREP